MFSSEAVTRGVRVLVQSEYAENQSRPAQNQWFFLYTVTISNEGAEPVQLLTRHWMITDGTGHVEEVRGPGVVGKQPTLQPGESFEYTSGCPLTDRLWRHGRHLPDGVGERRALRRQDRAVHPERALYRSLIGTRRHRQANAVSSRTLDSSCCR